MEKMLVKLRGDGYNRCYSFCSQPVPKIITEISHNIMTNGKPRKKDSARLTWDSKPRRAANPKDIEFQTAEVVIPNPQMAGELPLSFRDELLGEAELDKQKMNRLIWGDNLLAMQALLAQGYEGKINLIYIDPPFDSKADYSHKMTIEGSEYTKEPSVIERLAYKDTWVGGTDSYLDMLYPRLQLMKRLLAEDGSIYVHTDWHVNSYIRLILDEIFGRENFRNEIITRRGQTKNLAYQFSGVKTLNVFQDTIYWYSKNVNSKFNPPLRPALDYQRKGRWQSLWNNADRPTMRYELLGSIITSGQWKWSRDRALKAVENYKEYLEISKKNGENLDDYWRRTGEKLEFVRRIGESLPQYYVPPQEEVICDNNWLDIKGYDYSQNYDTAKSQILLSRVIQASSDNGDLIADFFAGSGTTGAVAENLGRRWIMCELGKVGIQVARSRLVEQKAKPFLIENIGNYQREMIYLTGGRIWEMQTLILKLYGATPRDKGSGLGARKAEDGVEELVYVGYPDRPITARKAEELALQAQKLDGTGYKRLVILGWDYEYNYREALESRFNALKDKIKVKVESRDIPPDIYHYLKKAKSEEDIEALANKVHFYERPYLRLETPIVKPTADGKAQVTLAIKRYTLMDIPISRESQKGKADYEALIKLAKDNFAVLIDYWAIDWDYDGCTFKSQWQAFRGNGKKAKTVPITASETLEKKKKRTVAVRVVDIFGNDAAATVEI